MSNEYFISITLDKRRKKRNGKYPVKLRAFTPEPRLQKLYPTQFEFTDDEFKRVWINKKTNAQNREARTALKAIEAKAQKVASQLDVFTFAAFENVLLNTKGKGDVNFYYREAIELYEKNKQIGTASNYEYSLKALLEFHKKETLNFKTITVQWLKDFEDFLLSGGKSQTTVGIYLRPLRAVFNRAITDKAIPVELYPFGKRKYAIPAPKSVKKALTKDQLKALFETEPTTSDQKKAKAFWFFSYACNGMNFKDIANLQYKNISGDTLTFRRAKTSRTNKSQAPVIVYLNEFTLSVIKEYGNQNTSPETFIFPIIEHTASPSEQHSQLKIFIRYINQHIKKFAQRAGITDKVSTYWARHSFATNAIRNGASLEFVSEALSHSDLKTTINYFAGFEDEKKREIAQKMMNF